MTNINNKLITLKYKMRHIEISLETRAITANDREELESLYLEILTLEEELQYKINNNSLTVADLDVRLTIWYMGTSSECAMLVDCYQKNMYNIGGELTLLNQRKRKLYRDGNRVYVKINGIRIYQ